MVGVHNYLPTGKVRTERCLPDSDRYISADVDDNRGKLGTDFSITYSARFTYYLCMIRFIKLILFAFWEPRTMRGLSRLMGYRAAGYRGPTVVLPGRMKI